MSDEAKSSGPTFTRREAVASLAAAGLGAFVLGETVAGAQQVPPKPSTWPGASFGPPPQKSGFKTLSGVGVYYEEFGRGIPLALNSGGMNACDTVRRIASKLGEKYRAIGWDRSNTGQSEVAFKGASDADLWSDQLAELLVSLGAAPAYIAGTSGGARTAFSFAVRYPDLTKGLILWDVTNTGPNLPRNYFGQYADLAEKSGLAAVAKTPYWADIIRRNPKNEKLLMDTDPQEFIRVMRRWTNSYLPTDVALQMGESEFRTLAAQGTPVRLVVGCDNGHNKATSDAMAKLLPNADYVTAPAFCEDEVKNFASAAAWAREHGEQTYMPHWETNSIVPMIDEFITKTEARPRTQG